MAYLSGRLAALLDRHEKVVVAGVDQIAEDLHDHVLTAGFGCVGQTVAKMLSSDDISNMAFDLDAT